MSQPDHERVIVLDFGSQYAQLIARRVRENKVYCEIVPHDISPNEVRELSPSGVIMSGGPASVYADGAPRCDPELFRMGTPILGICYGMQIGCDILGGKVTAAPSREYGRTPCRLDTSSPLFKGLPEETTVWMSHGDQAAQLPDDFESLAETGNCPSAAVKHTGSAFYGVQFHPEVTHTPLGTRMLHNFLFSVCGCRGDWDIGSYIDELVETIRDLVGKDRVVCGISGGVDSSVCAALVSRAIGKQLSCIFVDNGVLRLNEAQRVEESLRRHLDLDLHVVDASDRFLKRLEGVPHPEEKRRRIGHEFIAVFRDEAAKIGDFRFLAQGTLYPDVIESVPAHGGPTATIKTHHNVGGLPDEIGFDLLEPFRFLFKDEVRSIGEALGLPDDIVWRHPFPGPGLAVRLLGEVTRERLDVLRQADDIVVSEIREAGLYRDIAQAFAVLLPVGTVGVMGDERSYENVVVVRAVSTTDFMTADWVHLPYEVLGRIANRIINEVRGVNRVVYDVSTKPPSTIEWE